MTITHDELDLTVQPPSRHGTRELARHKTREPPHLALAQSSRHETRDTPSPSPSPSPSLLLVAITGDVSTVTVQAPRECQLVAVEGVMVSANRRNASYWNSFLLVNGFIIVASIKKISILKKENGLQGISPKTTTYDNSDNDKDGQLIISQARYITCQ